jgi:hypothetical protein
MKIFKPKLTLISYVMCPFCSALHDYALIMINASIHQVSAKEGHLFMWIHWGHQSLPKFFLHLLSWHLESISRWYVLRDARHRGWLTWFNVFHMCHNLILASSSVGGTTRTSHLDFPKPIKLQKIIGNTSMNIFINFLSWIHLLSSVYF